MDGENNMGKLTMQLAQPLSSTKRQAGSADAQVLVASLHDNSDGWHLRHACFLGVRSFHFEGKTARASFEISWARFPGRRQFRVSGEVPDQRLRLDPAGVRLRQPRNLCDWGERGAGGGFLKLGGPFLDG